MNILAINMGSSSLKVALFAVGAHGETCLARGAVDAIGAAGRGRLELRDGEGRTLVERDLHAATPVAALQSALDGLDGTNLPPADAIGHRLVHGGPTYHAPVLIDAQVRASLKRLVRFAPLHLPAELAVLDAAIVRSPASRQVACFDTAFHSGLPEVAAHLALPREHFDAGVRRYGFHGLSYEYVAGAIGAATLGRVVVAHLGSGASMVALKDGRSIETTMGLTPTGGLMMGTRVGDIDPGVLIHLMDTCAYDTRALESLLNERSGLLGVSATSSDMQVLLERRRDDPRAELAVEMFCYSARKSVGALAAVLGGLDVLVFTGGIGEHASAVRARICEGLGYLGVTLDLATNERGETSISAAGSACSTLVVKTDEERMIARHVARLIP